MSIVDKIKNKEAKKVEIPPTATNVEKNDYLGIIFS